MKRLLLIVLTLLLPLTQVAQAQDSDVRWVRKAIRGTCHDWGYCETRYQWVRYYRPRGYVHQAHYNPYATTYVDRGPLCLSAPVRERGEEHNTVNGAKIDAVRRWQAAVRADYGERFMDIATARNLVYDCHRSSTNESWTGKAAAFIGRQLERLTGDEEDAYKKRCVVVALPCREQLRPASSDRLPGNLPTNASESLSPQEMIRELERQGYKVSSGTPSPGAYQPRKRWLYRYMGRDR